MYLYKLAPNYEEAYRIMVSLRQTYNFIRTIPHTLRLLKSQKLYKIIHNLIFHLQTNHKTWITNQSVLSYK